MKSLMAKNRKRSKIPPESEKVDLAAFQRVWLKAAYHFHTFAYRDPRAAFSSAPGLPVVSPTAALLGIASTLFTLGKVPEAHDFLKEIHQCRVAVDPPEGVIFFRAFHQLRRYYSTTKGKKERAGFTNIGQGIREYGLVAGPITLFVCIPNKFVDCVTDALRNRDHLGTHDSLCSLIGDVEPCDEPEHVIYLSPEDWQIKPSDVSPVTILTLSRFKEQAIPTVGNHWWMAGGPNTELVPFMIKGKFTGTSRGKIYKKN